MAAQEKAKEPDLFEELRKPFPAKVYGKLYKAYSAEESKSARKAACQECGSYHSTAKGIHLDYVGHAAVTDRLLTVDPEWNWEPAALEQDGTPGFVRASGGNPLGLWIKLTVLGVTRLGYGSVDGRAFDPEKQLIGDAIRNAAMRFGVGLDMWSKEELESELGREDVSPVRKEKREAKPHASAVPPRTHLDRNTGELTPLDDPGESARMEREVAEAFGGTPVDEEAPAVREVFGVPITLGKSFDQIAHVKWPQFKNKRLDEMVEGAKNGQAERALSRVLNEAQDICENGSGALSEFHQHAVLALEEMLRLRGAKVAEEAGMGMASDLIKPAKEKA